jgi:uncharacterized protein
MALTVNLRHLEKKSVFLKDESDAAEFDLEIGDEVVRPDQIRYDLEVQKLEHNLLVQGNIEILLNCTCVRCLKEFNDQLNIDDWVCHLPLEGEDRAKVVNDCVDLTPYIREDILLGLPQHPLCQSDCRGLPERPPGKSNASRGTGPGDKPSSAWSELNKLKFEE